MMGKVVIHNEDIAARFHKMLRDAGRGVRRNIGKPGRVASFRYHNDGVLQRAIFTQVGDGLGNSGWALAYGAINAKNILAALVKDRADADGGLAGLPVAEDQFALSPPDGNERINDLDAALQGHGDRRAVHDLRRGTFNRQTLIGDYRPLAIKRPAQWIDDTPDQSLPHRHVHHMPPAFYFIARMQVPIIAEQDDADLILIDIECDAVQITGKPHHLFKTHAGKTRYPGNTRGQAGDR